MTIGLRGDGVTGLFRTDFLVGRGRQARLLLTDRTTSRAHAFFVRQGPGWSVIDLNSANGTFVNGTRVRHCPLADGDVVRLGGTLLTVTLFGDQLCTSAG